MRIKIKSEYNEIHDTRETSRGLELEDRQAIIEFVK